MGFSGNGIEKHQGGRRWQDKASNLLIAIRDSNFGLSDNEKWKDTRAPWRQGGFFKSLSIEAVHELESVAAPFVCEANDVLFVEEQFPSSALFLLEGNVRLSMNSIDGKRLTLAAVGPGDILGLAAALSGSRYETTAEAQFPCKIIPFPRQGFLDFLLRYPLAQQYITHQLSLEYLRVCDQLSILGLTLTAPVKLARLLLEWCSTGQRTEHGMRIHCSLTHEEIGEYIGVARETISRTMTDFKNRALIEQHGSTLLISSLRELEIYAGRTA